MMKRGVCRFCRCSELRPCPGGCGWTNEKTATLCTSCVEVSLAWEQLGPTRRPSLIRAFTRGYFVGARDVRAGDQVNPYAPGESAKYWERGRVAGKRR